MSDYKWTFANVGGTTRVRISKAEDLKHLGELDRKMWTVLSCPVNGLEIPADALQLIDTDGDCKIRIDEVVAAAGWLCAQLKDAQVVFDGSDSLNIDNIADKDVQAVAKKLAGKEKAISLAAVEAAIAAVAITPAAVPAAPYEADVMEAYRLKRAEYAAYYELEKLSKLGLAVIAEDVVKPGMAEKKFLEMGAKIDEFDAAVAAAAQADADALAAGQAEYRPLEKLLKLNRWFYALLRNYVTLEDFYTRDRLADFQCGTLYIDQRACRLCVRVQDAAAMTATAGQSGMYLLFCDCINKPTGKTMQIVAAMTVGEISSLTVGKNAIFYDRAGLDYDAKVTHIIDNPISIRQAFWSPYRRLAKWVEDTINKRAAEKDSKMMSETTDKLAAAEVPADKAAAPKPAFDIAKFAGIFAAIGMAVGMIGTALVALCSGLAELKWWQLILVFLGLMLIISGPAMLMAYLKLRRRNLAPVLNANGWAVNADAIISVPFGATLTDLVKYPLMKLSDPFAKKGMPCWKKWTIAICILLIICAACAYLYYLGYRPCCFCH